VNVRHQTKALAMDAILLVVFGHHLLDLSDPMRPLDAIYFTFSVVSLIQHSFDERADEVVPVSERSRTDLLLKILIGCETLRLFSWLATVVH